MQPGLEDAYAKLERIGERLWDVCYEHPPIPTSDVKSYWEVRAEILSGLAPNGPRYNADLQRLVDEAFPGRRGIASIMHRALLNVGMDYNAGTNGAALVFRPRAWDPEQMRTALRRYERTLRAQLNGGAADLPAEDTPPAMPP